MWIKICGNTNLEDAHLAVDLGANALGFVFADSPRRVNPSLAKQIIASLPASVETYGVFTNVDFTEVSRILSECGLSGIQLHRAHQGIAEKLRREFSRLERAIKIIGVVHRGAVPQHPLPAKAEVQIEERSAFEETLSNYDREQAVDYLLMDTASEGRSGGTGVAFDWDEAAQILARHGLSKPLIAAGGLRAENVSEAIAKLKPWGVDVVSGVEAAPGKKDPVRLRAFIAAARSSEIREPANVPATHPS